MFIAKSLSPATIVSVKIDRESEEKKKAIVTLTSDQKSEAIGRGGVNIRLASMLTGYEIEIKEVGVSDLFEAQESGGEEGGKKIGLDALESLFKE